MRSRRLIGGLVLALLAVAAGCQVVQRSRPVVVEVRDADTKKPIAAATVRLSDPMATLLGTGGVVETGADGVARLWAPGSGEAGLVVRAAAEGHHAEEKVVSSDAVQAIEPAHLFEPVDKRPVNVVVELYAEEPRPTVELVVPAGFRGQFKVEVQATGMCTPGQRRFSYAASPTGVTRIVGPDLFRHVSSPDFTARYANGPVLGPDPREGEVGFWCLHSDGRFYTFLVQTRKEYDFLRPRIREDWSDMPGAGGQYSRSGRGGKGGRRGGDQQPPAGGDRP